MEKSEVSLVLGCKRKYYIQILKMYLLKETKKKLSDKESVRNEKYFCVYLVNFSSFFGFGFSFLIENANKSHSGFQTFAGSL